MTNTNKLGLFVIGSDDNQDIETTLANNFQKIDDAHPDNKSILDKINQSGTESSFDLSGMAEKTDLHTHNNEATLDKITQTGSETSFDLSQMATKDQVANAGGGDMLKSVYDTSGNNQVDKSDDSDKLGGQSPTYYAKATEIDINNYTTTPTFDVNGILTQVEEADGTTVKKRTTLTYNSDGNVNTITEVLEGRTVVSTLNYTNGEFASVTKVLTDGGL